MIVRRLASLVVAASFLAMPAGSSTLLPGKFVGGFVDDDGSSLLLLRKGSSFPPEGSMFAHLSPSGETRALVEWPGVTAKSIRRLSDGRLLLSSVQIDSEDPTSDYGVWTTEIVALRADGTLRRNWEWNSKDHPAWLDWNEAVSMDGRAWAMSQFGLGEDGRISGDRMRVLVGDMRPGRAKVDREVVLRFDDMDDVSEFLGSSVLLDSEGPTMLVPWRHDEFVVDLSGQGSGHSEPVFERKKEKIAVWQWDERILWSQTKRVLRAYNFWDLSLSAGNEPFWTVARQLDGFAAYPHSERGLVRREHIDGRQRIVHEWRDPWTQLEERHVSDWFDGGMTAVLVSSNGMHAVVLDARASDAGVEYTAVRAIGLRFDAQTELPAVAAPATAAEDESSSPSDAEAEESQETPDSRRRKKMTSESELDTDDSDSDN